MASYCPVCGLNDQVKKASAIVAEATQSVSYYSGNPYTGMSYATTRSQLATKLLINKPQEKATWGCMSLYAITMFCSIAFISLAAVIYLGQPLHNPTPSIISGGMLVFAICGGSAFLLFLIKLAQSTINRQQWSADYARWQNDFDRRYYCYRDDCVFY